jgi:ABC-type lipoprotein export system ATPase subunit
MRGYRISFIYVVFLTHEESIARSAHRVLSILDGEIASDELASGESAGTN